MNNQSSMMQTYADNAAAATYGFAMAPSDILIMANISQQLLAGTLHYKDAASQIKNIVGNAFVYREGNKRIVIVSIHQRFVIKIAKLSGFEGIRDNMNEQASCVFMNTKSKNAHMKYAPKIIAVYGTTDFPALVLVQERHKEIFEEIAKGLGMRSNEQSLLREYISTVCVIGYPTVKKMLDNIASECFISDLPLVRSAANFSLNESGGFAVLDWGSILPKNGFEVRCPKCKAPMAYHVEDPEVFTSAVSMADMNVIKPVYRCIANPAHEIDPDVFFSRLTAGDQTVLMPVQEAQAFITNMQQSKQQAAVSANTNQDHPTAQQHVVNGIAYQVGAAQYNNGGIQYRRLFQNNIPTNTYLGANGQVVQG